MTPPLRRDFLKTGGLMLAASGLGIFSNSKIAVSSSKSSAMLSDAPQPINDKDRREREERAKALMLKNNMDAILLTGGSSMEYFTGVKWRRSERTFACVIPREGNTMWVGPAFEADRAEATIGSGANIYIWEEEESPFKLLAGIFKDLKINKGRIGLEETIRYFVSEGLKEAAKDVEFVSANPVVNGCRGIKTAHEIELLRYINNVTHNILQSTFSQMKDGMSQRELATVLSSEYAERGLREWAIVLFGANAAFPHGTDKRELLFPGQMVLVDTGTSFNGYQSDMTRTVIFGEPSKRQLDAWNAVKNAQSAALEKAAPGVKAEDVDKAARKVIEKSGFGKGYSVFTHRVGHGIGMDGHEFPYLVKGNRLRLQPGMTFSNEPGIYIQGELGVRIEDIMHITENGAELLTPQTKSMTEI